MDELGDEANGLLNRLAETRRQEQEELSNEIADMGGPMPWLEGAAPRVAALLPSPVTEIDLLGAPKGWYVDADERLATCAACPDHGGGCAKSIGTRFEPGQVPVWRVRDEGGQDLAAVECDKWREHRLRTRLGALGVPARYVGSTTKGFEFPSERAVSSVVSFCKEVVSGRPSWLLVLGARGAGKTHLSAAILRTILKRAPRTLGWFADLRAVRAEMRRLYDERQSGDPLSNARQARLLILENLEPEKYEKWFAERVESLITERWLAEKPTILTSSAPLAALAAAYPDLHGLEAVPLCQL